MPLILGCASPDAEALFCEWPCQIRALEAQGGAGGEDQATTTSTTGATSSTTSTNSTSASSTAASTSATTSTSAGGGDGGAGQGGGGAGGGVEPPECITDAGCQRETGECSEGRCVDGQCVATPVGDDVRCKVEDETSPRYGMDGWCSAGACADYVPVRCSTAMGTFVGCDGVAHPGQTISWSTDLGGKVECRSAGTDAARCEPGTACVVEYRSADTAFRYEGTCR
ncbi:hypothetical protein BE21_57605 [Sorangium cellulosum]|uniref:Uncharacterized protein n=1 Tax=Sorangium cellulosum TaxID=56 RepID=A0A150U3A5_SORCE|nr:hypothetical protein BE21_57605 [Sorangium cellulosum]